jgi:fatty acid desaturase
VLNSTLSLAGFALGELSRSAFHVACGGNVMKELNLPNVTLMALVASWFIQIGGQVFALIAVDGALAAAPPRSFAMLQGEYRYDSSLFWSTVPPLTSVLLIIALVTNWKTGRRKILLLALTLLMVTALVSMLYLEPLFDEIKAIGFRDEVDPALQRRAATWYATDWAIWCIALVGGITLLLALIRPVTTSKEDQEAA